MLEIVINLKDAGILNRLYFFQLFAVEVFIYLYIKIGYPVNRDQSHSYFFFENALAEFFKQFEAGVQIELAEFAPGQFHVINLSR